MQSLQETARKDKAEDDEMNFSIHTDDSLENNVHWQADMNNGDPN